MGSRIQSYGACSITEVDLEPDELRALVTDRETVGSDFLEVLDHREIPFVIQLKKDRRIRPSSGEWSFP